MISNDDKTKKNTTCQKLIYYNERGLDDEQKKQANQIEYSR